jgi:hypothetical protein
MYMSGGCGGTGSKFLSLPVAKYAINASFLVSIERASNRLHFCKFQHHSHFECQIEAPSVRTLDDHLTSR